jgi:hypothetical protein
MFAEFLQKLAYTLFFEDHTNVWIFQKAVHSTILMCEGGAQQGVHNSYEIIKSVIDKNELSVERRALLQAEVDALLGLSGAGKNKFPRQGLDVKSREDF